MMITFGSSVSILTATTGSVFWTRLAFARCGPELLCTYGTGAAAGIQFAGGAITATTGSGGGECRGIDRKLSHQLNQRRPVLLNLAGELAASLAAAQMFVQLRAVLLARN